jgi:putative oxidoreductase
MKIGRLFLRLTVGGLFMGHGLQKLLGWFGGYGIEGTGGFFESIGLRPGKANAIAAGVSETAGGAMLAAGAATPLAASTLIATMLTAINRVHLKNGPWVTNGGYEYNLVLIAAVTALVEVGPGPLSVDAALGKEVHGPGWALAALLAGAAGAAGAHYIAESQKPPEPTVATASVVDSGTVGEPAVAAVPGDDGGGSAA